MPFGFVVDDLSPDKAAAGGAGPFALGLAEREQDEAAHSLGCPTCRALGEPFACVGVIPTPLPASVERWLVDRLPDDIESLPGFLLRKAIGDFDYTGDFGKQLRAEGLLEAPSPFTRHFGPFFRRFTVSSEQLIEELLGAGDINPAHALAVLAHLGAVAVDGEVLLTLDEGAKYGEVIEHLDQRAARTTCLVTTDPSDDDRLAALKRFLRALWAGFIVDAPVKVFDAR
ncbi:MAG: hypothetical protein EXR72_00015 [Myxococcales bacterium]|nr:hypothetical protein [Myxococcales bacterium]